MKLYLAQHGDSVPEAVDPERPLSERGHDDVERLAQFLALGGMRVPRVCHSGKLRARQTAELLAARVGSADAIEAVSGLNPNDPIEPVADRINTWTDDTLLVGHLPFMARLLAYLVSGDSGRQVALFRPGTITCLERDAEGRWALAWMLRPELLGRQLDQSL